MKHDSKGIEKKYICTACHMTTLEKNNGSVASMPMRIGIGMYRKERASTQTKR
jgi:hypothetical protein